MFWKRGCLQTASLYTKTRICCWLWYYQYVWFMSSLILWWDKLSYVLCLFCLGFFTFPIWDSTRLVVKIPTPYVRFPVSSTNCVAAINFHVLFILGDCSHYLTQNFLREKLHRWLFPLPSLSRSCMLHSSIRIVPRHQTLFPVTFLYWLPEQHSFPVFLRCFISAVLKIIILYLNVKCCSIYKVNFVPISSFYF